MKITIETGDKGVYLVIKESKDVVSEFMIPNYTLDFLYPILTSAMFSGIPLQGTIVPLTPPCQEKKD